MADVVERAAETYGARAAGYETARALYARLAAQAGTDVDLGAAYRELPSASASGGDREEQDRRRLTLGFTDETAPAYGGVPGHVTSDPGGMIAAIARMNGGRPATRIPMDFKTTGLHRLFSWGLRRGAGIARG